MPDLTAPLAALDDRLDRIKRRLSGRLGRAEPIAVLPFRGYGTAERLRLRGRVLEAEALSQAEDGSTLDNLLTMLRRYESDEIADAEVEVRLGDRRHVVRSDQEGYFEVELEGLDDGEAESPWTRLDLRLLSPRHSDADDLAAEGWVRVPGADAQRGIVSDMDDTVVVTGATDLLRHARTVLLNDAESRDPFPGVPPLYRALAGGPGGGEGNPIFYVSSSQWNVYDLFETFLELHDVPLGPILLKDFGVDRGKLFKRGHVDYKAERVGAILETYPELPFLFLGDTGQKDAWVVEEVVERWPGRIVAAYLRDLDPEKPDAEIVEIERRLRDRGVPLLRAADSAAVADDALERGWISEDQAAEVRQQCRA